PQKSVTQHSIPGTLNVADWTYPSNGNPRFENDAKGVGYLKNGGTANIDFHCNKAGVYQMVWNVSYNKGGDVNIIIKDLATGDVEVEQLWTIVGGTSTIPLDGFITEGDKNLTFNFTSSQSSWIANYFSPTFEWVTDEYDATSVPTGWETIPGALDINNWTYTGSLRVENNGGNVGWVNSGDKANYHFFCTDPGVYRMDMEIPWFNASADLGITITDRVTKTKQVDTKYLVTGTQNAQILLPGLITTGKKDIEFNIITTNGGFIINWKTPTFVKVGETFATVSSVTTAVEGVQPVEQDGFDWAFNIPSDFNGSDVTFDVSNLNSTLTATSEQAEVTSLGDGKFSIPVPAPNAETVVKLAITPAEGAYSEKTEYTVRFFRIGGVILTGLKVNSLDVDADKVAAINEANGQTVDGYVFTALPKVKATFIDGSTADATAKLNGTKATYTFTGTSGDKSKAFSFDVEGVHIYNRTADDKDAKIVFDSNNVKKGDGDYWTDGLFTVKPCGDGWGGTQFKLRGNSTVTVSAPADMKVNQLILAQLFDNYQPGRIKSITSGDATIWMPTESSFTKGGDGKYNLVVNVENHVVGTPFAIEIEGGDQPVMWFEFVYETVVPTDAPELVSVTSTPLTGKNHTAITFTMNREVKDTDVMFNGVSVHGIANGVNLVFPVWDLEYDADYTFTIPAGAVSDTYGNTNAEPLSFSFTTGSNGEEVVPMESDRFITVSNAAELVAAVASLSQTNNKADAQTTVIYMLNGDYDLGADTKATDPCLHLKNLYNVSLIGESQEGVLLHGTRTGISYPVFSTRYSTNIYMENFTVRNDLDFGKAERVGVGVAHVGGNLDIMKNVTLQSIQDTQVTGERGYYLNCTIHGTVDYICGGGDHYYDHCTLVQEGGGYVTAPSTSASLRHGYVFNNCTIKGEAGYYLGRPWQNEPRCFWLNTTMIAKPADAGWGGMSNLTTHFYEYNSMDANGNPIDLSKRTNSSTSLNTYSPILPEEYVSYFNPRNVLGSTDSWNAEALTAECEAPVVTYDETSVKWNEVFGAVGYIIFLNGQQLAFTSDTEYPLASAAAKARAAEAPVYTVAAVNSNGARGVVSAPASDTTGLEIVGMDAATAVEYFNLQGIKVDASAKGALIRVAIHADGSRKAEKVLVK
ncbi:MAG: hypothetical protein K2H87_00910, partial [Duncaniella sp.]|nr:hypothetical protein [Duncaniella sp.]